MGRAIGELLPSAIGVALSPVPIIAVILILGTPRASSNGRAFAFGWVVGLAAVSALVVLIAGAADDPDSGSSTAADVLKLALGTLFMVMALSQWRKRPRERETAELPGWMQTIDRFTPGRSLVLGAVLSGANPKNLALTLAAATSVAEAGLSGGATVASIGVFVVIGSLTVAGPVLYSVIARDRAAAPLASIKQVLSDHNAVIMMVVFLVLGGKLVGNGIAGLTD